MKNSKQKIKVTIHQTKIVSSVVVPFYMKLKINEVCQISDQISEKLFDYNKVNKYVIEEFYLRIKH